MKHTNGLYVNIEKHDGVHDYEFFEGEVVEITDVRFNDDDGEYDFRINGIEACCTPEEFEASWVRLDISSAWFEFRENLDPDCYDVLNAFTLEVVMTREAEDVIQLSDIKYIESEDLISGVVTYITEEDMFPEIADNYTRVLIPRTSVLQFAY